jgi:hypothetical protein
MTVIPAGRMNKQHMLAKDGNADNVKVKERIFTRGDLQEKTDPGSICANTKAHHG